MSNIDNSLKHIKRIRKFIGHSIHNFKHYYHIKNNFNAEKLFFETKAKHKSFPVKYRSYSTASDMVSNMKNKTDLIDLVIGNHIINGDMTSRNVGKFIDCGRSLEFGIGRDKNTGYRHHHLSGGFVCDFKFCPMRQHLNAKKRFNQIYTELLAMYSKYNWCPIMITLTIPSVNPTPRKVRNAYKNLTKSWKAMSKYKTYDGDNRYIRKNKGILKGWIEKFEFTYNWLSNTIHPHLHIIGLVRKSYLTKQGSKYYVTQKRLLSDWRRAFGSNRIKEVSIEAPYYKKNGNKIHIQDCATKAERKLCILHATKEISKYEGKSVEFTKMPKLHLDFNSNKWAKSQADKVIKQFHCKRTDADEYVKSIQYKRTYLLNHINRKQLNSINAFHAILKGLRSCRILHFGGYASRFNHFYQIGGLKKYQTKPDVTYKYKIISKFNFKYKDYKDTKVPFTKADIIAYKAHGLKIEPDKKARALEIIKNITHKKAVSMGFNKYLKVCHIAGLRFN